jgi:hypothetical protein
MGLGLVPWEKWLPPYAVGLIYLVPTILCAMALPRWKWGEFILIPLGSPTALGERGCGLPKAGTCSTPRPMSEEAPGPKVTTT